MLILLLSVQFFSVAAISSAGVHVAVNSDGEQELSTKLLRRHEALGDVQGGGGALLSIEDKIVGNAGADAEIFRVKLDIYRFIINKTRGGGEYGSLGEFSLYDGKFAKMDMMEQLQSVAVVDDQGNPVESGYDPWKMFDGKQGNLKMQVGHALVMEMKEPTLITSYSWRTSAEPAEMDPTVFEFGGMKRGEKWQVLGVHQDWYTSFDRNQIVGPFVCSSNGSLPFYPLSTTPSTTSTTMTFTSTTATTTTTTITVDPLAEPTPLPFSKVLPCDTTTTDTGTTTSTSTTTSTTTSTSTTTTTSTTTISTTETSTSTTTSTVTTTSTATTTETTTFTGTSTATTTVTQTTSTETTITPPITADPRVAEEPAEPAPCARNDLPKFALPNKTKQGGTGGTSGTGGGEPIAVRTTVPQEKTTTVPPSTTYLSQVNFIKGAGTLGTLGTMGTIGTSAVDTKQIPDNAPVVLQASMQKLSSLPFTSEANADKEERVAK